MRAVLPIVLVALAARMSAFQAPLDRRAIEEALDIAHSTIESTHQRFHADYRLPAAKPPVDFIEVVTPFRRLVLAAETEHRLGRRLFGQREALAALQPDPERVEIYVELTFHPHNTFVGVPEYTVELIPLSRPGPPLKADAIERLPRFGPRLNQEWYPYPYPYAVAPRVPSGSQPLLGGTLIARFDGTRLDPNGVYAVVVKDGTTEPARATVDFARLR